jgi:N-acetylmuramoyl-L-alanine amidase
MTRRLALTSMRAVPLIRLRLLAVAALGLLASCASSAAPPVPAPVAAKPAVPSISPAASSAPRSSLAGKIIAVDPGHNGNAAAHPEIVNKLVNAVSKWKPCETTGTETNAGYQESAFNLDVAIRLAAILRAAGATVVLTRTDNNGVGPCFDERAAIGNRAHAAVAISIHADGAPAGDHGFHVLEPVDVHGPSTAILAPSRRLAVDIRDAYRSGTGLPAANYIGRDGIDPRSDMGGLNLSTVPKVLLECGNMRNAGDAAKLSSPEFRQRAAAAIAAGLARYLAG